MVLSPCTPLLTPAPSALTTPPPDSCSPYLPESNLKVPSAQHRQLPINMSYLPQDLMLSVSCLTLSLLKKSEENAVCFIPCPRACGGQSWCQESFSTLVFEIGSLVEPGAQQLGKTSQQAPRTLLSQCGWGYRCTLSRLAFHLGLESQMQGLMLVWQIR